ncbi:MAG TPA: ester cyclase [Dehalococcoidia bacterium]|jgi:predicted ester cyclase|nr:ester cyclase [Dehalococcoidia bacterium]
MSTERNKAVVRRYFEEARNTGALDVVDEIFASEFIRHSRRGSQPGFPAEQKRVIVQWRAAFPDYRDTVVSLVAEGDWVAAHIMFSGTHTGVFEFGGLGPWAPTGKSMQCWEFFLYRLADEKIVEMRALWDRLDFVQQLGLGGVAAPSSALRTG